MIHAAVAQARNTSIAALSPDRKPHAWHIRTEDRFHEIAHLEMPTVIETFCMRIFLTGVSCVGKTTIGARLAGLLEYRFFDLDLETERFFETSIERLRNRYLTSHEFRLAASRALKQVLAREDSSDSVIALPPGGLLGGYWKVVNATPNATVVVLRDRPENILNRITFYDIDSRPLHKVLTDQERELYLREIERDIAYFNRSYRRAQVSVDIAGRDPDEASRKVRDSLTPAPLRDRRQA
ncbi:shikimate kinase [Bradyrhizobium sp.]|uniref:shikimate kinase n=1 Tax=Bradyrhizobium sp. TaxID=376 RepID=UPI003C438416